VNAPRRAASLLALAVSLLTVLARGQAPAIDLSPPPPKNVGFDQNIGRTVPLDATFRDETGKTVRLGDYFADKPVVLSLAYFACPMLCSLSMQGLSGSLKGINLDAGRDFELITISFDPRETSAMARAKKDTAIQRYGRPGAALGWHFLTGDEAAIQQVTSTVGFRYEWDASIQEYAHPTGIVVLTPDGKVARYLFGVEYAPKDLRLSLVEASHGNLGTVVDQLLLLCYHYDPKAGRYGRVAIGAMRAGGALTLLSLGALVVVMTRKEKRARKKTARGEGQ
jgi:protein SCO1